MRVLILTGVLMMAWQPARAQTGRTLTAAQAAFMAQVTPIVCPLVETDYDALRSFMRTHNLSQQDLVRTDRSGREAMKSFEGFEQAYTYDADAACQTAFGTLGPGGQGLLVQAGRN